jgi:undecaprenyl-diphosphatase
MLTWIHEIDWRVLDWIYKHTRTRLGNFVMPLISISGNFGFIWFLTAAAFYFLKRSQDAAEAIFFALVISSFLGNIVMKNLVRRPRPFNIREGYDTIIEHPVDLSFPSGHTFSSFAAASAVCFYLPFWGALSLLFAGCIAFSRLYLCVHFLSDVLTSAVLGVGTGIAVHYLVNMNLF